MTSEERNHAHYLKMTETPVSSLISRLAVPTIISMLISAIYNMADTFFVSQLGTSASAAVGVVYSIMAIIQAVGFSIGMGTGILASSTLGARDRERANTIASSGIAMGFVLSFILMSLGLIFNKSLMRVLGATETILPYAEAYSRYIFIASPFMIGSFVLNNILRGEGKATYAMVGITSGGILNILLDPIFIFTFSLGTAGAALATALSQAISFFILLYGFLSGRSNIHLSLRKISREKKVYLTIIKTGFPSLSRQGLASISTTLLNVNAAQFGDAAVAAMSITGRITAFMFSALLGFGQGFQPVSGYNWGAKRYDRVKKATLFTAAVGTIIITLLSAFCFIFARPIITLFRKDDLEVIRIGVLALRAQCLFMPLTGVTVTTNMGMQSTSHVKAATFLALTRQGIFFIPSIIILPPLIGLLGVQITQPISDGAAFILTLFFFAHYMKELNGKIRESAKS